MDKVPNGIEPMLKDLEEHIVSAGLADMVAAAETITTVSVLLWKNKQSWQLDAVIVGHTRVEIVFEDSWSKHETLQYP